MMFALTCARVVLLWMTMLVPPETVSWSSSYAETALATASACSDDLRCAAVLTSIGYYESRFRPDAVGDSGQSVGVWQISRYWLGSEDLTVWSHASTAARLVRQSLSICRGKPLEERLGWYARGGGLCSGAQQSRPRMRLAMALLGKEGEL